MVLEPNPSSDMSDASNMSNLEPVSRLKNPMEIFDLVGYV
jgi:hypothetical protein